VAVSDSLIDTLFDGRYRIERKLGAGGMADVYLAEDQELGRRVAIKILNGRHANDAQFIERFRREAKNAAALNHPNIVSIYDRGEAEDTYYIAMEYLDGRTLKELIVGRGAAPVNVAIEYARQILSALRFAHRHGIVHRDIKPHNVLVDGEGRVKVTDFGIARAGTSQMTEAGSIVGTAQYLSPEQARGGEVDPRSDLYSLGIVLYELLTGKTPFDGETPVEIAMKHLSNTPKPPSKLRPEIPPELDMVVLRALAKNPDDRYQNADEMEADLERVARGRPVAATTVDSATQVMRTAPAAAALAGATAATMIAPPAATAATTVAPPPVVEEEEYTEPGGADRPLWPWLVAAGFVVAAIVAGFFVYHELSGSTPQVTVNNYVNEPLANAQHQITAAGLHAKVDKGPSERFRQGIVFRQDPTAGHTVDKGGTVHIWVSTGPPKVSVPDVKGQQWTQAEAALTNAGLQPVEHLVGGNTKGQVTATDPAANTKVPKHSKVRVNVMSGPETATVPSVVGDSLSEATAALHNAGFNANPTYVNNSTAPQNQVISQNPAPNSSEPKDSTVNLNVSNGPPQVSVPPVVGETAQQAVGDLESAGFKVSQQYINVTDPTQAGIVQSQSPAGGSQAAKDSQVTIVIGQHSSGPPPPTTTTTTTTGIG
jgi:serine/threonine-protein kinase